MGSDVQAFYPIDDVEASPAAYPWSYDTEGGRRFFVERVQDSEPMTKELPAGLQLVSYIGQAGRVTLHQANCGHAQYGRGKRRVADSSQWVTKMQDIDKLTTDQIRDMLNVGAEAFGEAWRVREVRRCKHCGGRTYRSPKP